ncbi:hypothetical protein PIB30_085485, partial [Stylosanthes scabra]|nr:hypothetical protein [Stylosanthes scabra]
MGKATACHCGYEEQPRIFGNGEENSPPPKVADLYASSPIRRRDIVASSCNDPTS